MLPSTPPQAELWQSLTEPVRADVWTENTLAWSPPKRGERTVSVDVLGHSLVVRVPDGTVESVIPLSRCTDVRVRPFDDETASAGPLDLTKTNPFVTEDDALLYIGVAHYKDGVPDFKDVNIFSFVLRCPEGDNAASRHEAWVSGLRHLIAYAYPWSPRYVSIDERLARLFSFVRAHESAGVIPLAALQDQIHGYQYEKVVEVLKAAKILQGKVSLDAALFTYDTFRNAIMSNLIVPAIKFWFDELAGEDGCLDPDAVCGLLTSVQRDPRANEVLDALPTQASAMTFIERYATPNSPTGKMDIDAFVKYVLSIDNDYIAPEHRGIFEDMNYPLCAYFIASSHNTFLVAGQVFSSPKVEIYRQVLLSGCRCVEVDIWNGKAADGTDCPVVTHGPVEYTHCKTILFRDVIRAIKDAAFVYSDYPVILSFENHCNLANQQTMAKDVLAVFGDLLCREFMEGDGGTGKTLPSPTQLMRKIIVKNKRLKHLERRADSAEADSEEGTIRFLLDGDVEEETEEEKERRLSKSKVVAEELSDLVNYVWPVSFKGFDVAFQTDNCYHMSSFNEAKAIKYAAAGAEIFSTYCQKQLARVYPKGTRLSSSNYNPLAAWSVGAQLVALNYQTIDSYPMHYNLGMFAPNGTCGYRLKPVCMRGHYYESVPVHRFANYQPFTPLTEIGIEQVVQWDLGVTVLAAPCVGGTAPVVTITMGGIPADDTQNRPWELHLRDRRKFVVPHWKAQNEFRVPRVILPDLALLRIVVTDRNSGGVLGWECIPVYELKPGYHAVPLRHALSPLAHVLLKFDYSLHSGEHSDIVDKLVNPTDYSSKEAKVQAMTMMNAPDAEGDQVDVDAVVPEAAAESPAPTAVSSQPVSATVRRELMVQFVSQLEELARTIKAEAGDPDRRGNTFVRSPRPSELMSRDLEAEHEKHLQARRKLSIAYDREEAASVGEFKAELKQLFQRPVQPAREMNSRLLQAEIDMKRRQLDAWTQTLQRLHKMILEQEQALGKGRLKRLTDFQDAAAKNMTRKFNEVAANAIKEGLRLFKLDPTSPSGKKEFQAAWNQIEETFLEKSLDPIVADALGTARNVHNEQKRKVEAETKEGVLKLRKFQERDSLVIQKQFESEEKKLLELQATDGPYRWEGMTLRAYVDTLVADGRLPK